MSTYGTPETYGKSKCDNCGKVCDDGDLKEIEDYFMRVTPGGLAPSGECPDCGALCFPME